MGFQRSGQVILKSTILTLQWGCGFRGVKKAKCEYLVSDVFSGYKKSVRETNKYREEHGLGKLQNIYCNAHARRKFKEAQENYPEESQFFRMLKKIYRLEKIAQKGLQTGFYGFENI